LIRKWKITLLNSAVSQVPREFQDSSRLRFELIANIRVKDAKKFLDRHKRVDAAIDAYYNDPSAIAATARRQTESSMPSTSKLNALFDKYKGMVSLVPIALISRTYIEVSSIRPRCC
jgi:hypothetical protein